MSNYRERLYVSKLVLLGDSSVGKTSIVNQFVNNSFSKFQDSTIGAAFLSKSVFIGNDEVRFEIWDTAGQERYHSLAPMYYRNANIVLVVYDITNYTSFHGAKRWINELYKTVNHDVKIILIGNKKDLEHLRLIREIEVYNYTNEMCLQHYEISAKDKKSIDKLFENIANTIDFSKYQDQLSNSLNLEKVKKKKNKCCY